MTKANRARIVKGIKYIRVWALPYVQGAEEIACFLPIASPSFGDEFVAVFRAVNVHFQIKVGQNISYYVL